MSTSPVLFSSKSDDWPTAQDFFDKMNRSYGPFDLDVCAIPQNAKCPRFYTSVDDGLQQPWVGRCWMNPPYGKTIGKWIRKAWEASVEGATVVCLFRPGLIRDGGMTSSSRMRPRSFSSRVGYGLAMENSPPPFPSAVVVFKPAELYRCHRCERPFVPKRTDSKFCSGACRQGAYRARLVTDISVTQVAREANQ